MEGFGDMLCAVPHPDRDTARDGGRTDLASDRRTDAADGPEHRGRKLGRFLEPSLLIHDRDAKLCESFRSTLMAGGVSPWKLPPRRLNLNAFAERWVR